MPRVEDEKLIPTRPPNDATRAALRAFADRLRMEGVLHLNSLRAMLDVLVEDLEAGRAESIPLSCRDIADTMERFVAVASVGTNVLESITALDPLYNQALEPMRAELKVLAAMRLVRDMDVELLRGTLQFHSFTCRDAACAVHVAIRRTLAAKSGGGSP